MALGTTTWKNRNTEKLLATRQAVYDLGMYNPTIIEYGPGGMVDSFIDLLPRGDKREWNNFEKFYRGIFKITESGLRKTGLFALKSCEPFELADIFADLSPKMLYVVDKEPKVLEAIMQMVRYYDIKVPVSCHLLNVENRQFSQQADIVIAYNMIQRTKRPEVTLEHIANTTRIGGLLSSTITYAPKGFEQIGEGLYLRNY